METNENTRNFYANVDDNNNSQAWCRQDGARPDEIAFAVITLISKLFK